MSDTDSKSCPLCGESILAIAIKCKHCGSMLQGEAAAPPNATAPTTKAEPDETLGAVMIGVPLLATLAVWGWVGEMRLIDNPGTSLGMVTLLTVASTAVLALVEAGRLGMGNPNDLTAKGKRRENPGTWAFSFLVCWIAFYPYYLARRAVYGCKNLLVPGLLVAVSFIGSAAIVQFQITEKQQQLQRSFDGLRNLGGMR